MIASIIKYVETLCINWGYPGIAKYVGIILTFLIGSFLPFLWKCLNFLYSYLQQRRINKDLHPFYTPLDTKRATQYYIPTKHFLLDPSGRIKLEQPLHSEKTLSFFLRHVFSIAKDRHNFYIILADSGMGKTTFLINLYLKYITQIKILNKKHDIKLLPLGYNEVDKELDQVKDTENTIFLLDALDEDRKAIEDYETRLNEILQKLWRARKVIITCRTQFFPTTEKEPTKTPIPVFGGDKGFYEFRKIYLSPFSDYDITKYLNKKFGIFRFWNYSKKYKAKQIVKYSPDLMVRPLLLSYIDDLLQGKPQYEYTYMVYEELVDKWIEREAKMPGKRGNYKTELYKFSVAIALNMYLNRKKRGGLFMNGEDIKPFAQNHQIELEEIDMKSRSLLNRNTYGEYKFSHKSILEYFIAIEAFNNEGFKLDLPSKQASSSDCWRYAVFNTC